MKPKQGTLALILSCLVGISAYGQNTIQFNDVKVTEEGAIRLSWASNSNEVYRIECADQLVDTNTGLTDWQPLYALHYPSHGTNTFWLDTGNYDIDTPIPHPKYSPMRFYRIVSEGTNDGAMPYVNIDTPTNGSVLSDQVTISVTATSSMPAVFVKLFVDGQEMYMPDDGSNFVINTCEWANGPHTLFATATSQSDLPGPSGSYPISVGRAVSPYVTLNFSNLISKIAFSQHFFEPSLGQTQEVTASFAAPVDWTLQIVDEDSNAVRTVTGSGNSLVYDWDGTGDGGTNIADGVYYYHISAATNGGSFSMALSETSLSMSSTISEPETLWALSPGGSTFPLALYPLGADTNGFTLFEATSSEVWGTEESSILLDAEAGGAAAADYSGPSSQDATAPTRPNTAPMKNAVNSYAVGYYSFPKGPRTNNIPKNGITFPATGVVHLDGCSTCSGAISDDIPGGDMLAVTMIREFKRRGWKLVFEKANEDLSVQSMRRSDQGYNGGEIFTQATVGLFLDHGSYGLDPDYSPGSSSAKNTYWMSGNYADSGDNAWLRMCQFGFGGNLKWMALLACNSLCDPNYSSMVSHGAIPLKTTHLVCGCATVVGAAWELGGHWAQNMTAKKETIKQAWFDAGYQECHDPHINGASSLPNPSIFRVAGYPECMDDTVATNTAPTSPSSAPGNLTKADFQIYP